MDLLPPPRIREFQPIVTIIAVAICICVTLGITLNHATTDPVMAMRWGLDGDRAIYQDGKWWVLITSAFVHVQVIHILFNMTWLWSLGGAFERAYGGIRLALFIVFTAFVSSGLNLATGSSGIGMSGVVYALFGFAWVARRRIDVFAAIIDDRTVQIMVGWAFLCIVLTYANILKVGNAAHFGGMAIGAALAGILYTPKFRIAAGLGAIVLFAGSIVPLFWNPLSPELAFVKMTKALNSMRYDEAVPLIKRCLALNALNSPAEGWRTIAEIERHRGNEAAYTEAISELRVLNPEMAESVVKEYGQPKQ